MLRVLIPWHTTVLPRYSSPQKKGFLIILMCRLISDYYEIIKLQPSGIANVLRFLLYKITQVGSIIEPGKIDHGITGNEGQIKLIPVDGLTQKATFYEISFIFLSRLCFWDRWFCINL